MRWGWLIVLGATLGALLLFLANESVPVRVSTTRSVSCPVSTETRRVGETRTMAIFQQIVEARERATREASAVVPGSEGNGSPFAPDASDKGEAKRVALAGLLVARLLGEIAADHGMTVEKVEEIFREGQTKRWLRR